MRRLLDRLLRREPNTTRKPVGGVCPLEVKQLADKLAPALSYMRSCLEPQGIRIEMEAHGLAVRFEGFYGCKSVGFAWVHETPGVPMSTKLCAVMDEFRRNSAPLRWQDALEGGRQVLTTAITNRMDVSFTVPQGVAWQCTKRR